MQAIRTFFKGATDTRGSRIVATSTGVRTSMPYDYELSLDDNHRRAAELHIGATSWNPPGGAQFAHGILPDGSHAHILTGWF